MEVEGPDVGTLRGIEASLTEERQGTVPEGLATDVAIDMARADIRTQSSPRSRRAS